MPCKGDYLDPNQTEQNQHLVSQLIVFVDGKLGRKTDSKIKKAAEDIYGTGVKLDDIVPMLCTTLQSLSKKQENDIVYNARDKQSRQLADWWEEHQKADKQRLQKELKKVNEKKAKEIALSKLTPYERELLGY